MPDGRRGKTSEAFLDCINLDGYVFGVGVKLSSALGQGNATRGAMQELAAEFRLEFAQMLTEGWLRDAQTQRVLRERAFFGYGNEIFQNSNIHWNRGAG